MHLFEKNIKDLGLIISEPPAAIANYVPFKVVDNLVFVSGQGPIQNGKIMYAGKVGDDVSEEDGILAAQLCCLNIIASLRKSIKGDWNKLDNFVKLGGFVNCRDGYTNQPKIINGASDLLVNIFSEQGKHTRFAVGSNSLPMNISVEIDAIIKIK
jgi:enamine deaminase RidA (YjgF/YER057c/UK114 family)